MPRKPKEPPQNLPIPEIIDYEFISSKVGIVCNTLNKYKYVIPKEDLIGFTALVVLEALKEFDKVKGEFNTCIGLIARRLADRERYAYFKELRVFNAIQDKKQEIYTKRRWSEDNNEPEDFDEQTFGDTQWLD